MTATSIQDGKVAVYSDENLKNKKEEVAGNNLTIEAYKVSKNGIETILTSEKNNTKLQDEKDIELWIKKEINRLANMKLELMDVLEVANE